MEKLFQANGTKKKKRGLHYSYSIMKKNSLDPKLILRDNDHFFLAKRTTHE